MHRTGNIGILNCKPAEVNGTKAKSLRTSPEMPHRRQKSRARKQSLLGSQFVYIGVLSNDFRVGSFSSVTYQKLLPALAVTLVVLVLLFTLSNELEVLALGDESAKGLGLNTNWMRMLFLLLAALLAGAAVSVCGLLSFVGLLVPHAVRRIAGTRSRHLLPLSALLGAGFVALCDTLSRVLFSPYEIPVGIMMAFLGAPFFLFILVKGKGGHSRA